ncbi:MAG: hypothetical protein PHV61_01975 [Limnochordia bacterium]|jgi:hypothetical protein|nr:hypothetical protein [Limnochordia bacterium]MDD4518655.1 hypothetical protein [Limnochordia bacterium]
MSGLIMNPEYEAVLNEYTRLQRQLAVIIEHRADLIYHQATRLKTEYIMKIGTLEYDLFQLECDIARTRRKIQMVQACINQQVPFNQRQLEQQLDQEYEEYMERLKEMAAEIDLADYLNECPKLSQEETAEVKKLYRSIVKVLHPDINPSLTDEQKALWNQATDAYCTGNVEMLGVLSELILQGESSSNGSLSAVEELKEKIRLLEKRMKDLLLEIEKIKQIFPFNLSDFLRDAEQIKHKQGELRSAIEQAKKTLEELRRYLTVLILSANTCQN